MNPSGVKGERQPVGHSIRVHPHEIAIMAFIDESFEPAAVVIENFPLFPFGKRVIDKQGGKMVVYFDLLSDQVKWVFPSK